MRRKWFEFEILGVPWKMYVADEKSCAFLTDGTEGYTDRETCACFVHVRLTSNRARAEEVAAHEIEHAINTSTGATSLVFGCDESKEEQSILMTNGARFAAYKSAGLIRFPRLPWKG